MSCNEWKEYELLEVIEKFIDYRGRTPKKVEEGIPLVTAKVVKNGRINTPTEFIKEEDYEKWMTRGIPKLGDVVLTTEAPLGEVAQINTNYKIALAQRIITLRGKCDIINNTFLKYSLQSPIMQHRLEQRASGTTVLGIKSSELKKVKIDIPSLEEQEKIVNILSSLDNKIELNNDMNKTLEEMAQSLFKRWFVDFEFPNDDGEPYKSSGGEMVESELGMIPKGWKVTELGDVVDSISVKHKFPNDKIIFLNTSDILDGEILHNDYSEVESLPGQAKKSIKKGDILYSEIRPKNKRFAYINFDADEYVVSTKLMVLRAKNNINPAMLYFYLTSEGTINYLQMLAESRSGTFPQITFSQVKDIKVAIPKGELLVRLGEVFETLLNSIWNNKIEIKELSELRDSLLPKLMNGEIRVK